MKGRMRPVMFMISKTMFNRVKMDVEKGITELVIGRNQFTFEPRVEKRASAGVNFVNRFGVAVEEIGRLFSDKTVD